MYEKHVALKSLMTIRCHDSLGLIGLITQKRPRRSRDLICIHGGPNALVTTCVIFY